MLENLSDSNDSTYYPNIYSDHDDDDNDDNGDNGGDGDGDGDGDGYGYGDNDHLDVIVVDLTQEDDAPRRMMGRHLELEHWNDCNEQALMLGPSNAVTLPICSIGESGPLSVLNACEFHTWRRGRQCASSHCSFCKRAHQSPDPGSRDKIQEVVHHMCSIHPTPSAVHW